MDSKQLFEKEKFSDLSEGTKEAVERWRLILGKKSEDQDFTFNPGGEKRKSNEEEKQEGDGKGEGGGEGKGEAERKGEHDKEGEGQRKGKAKKQQRQSEKENQCEDGGKNGQNSGKINQFGSSNDDESQKKSTVAMKTSTQQMNHNLDKLKRMDDTLGLVYGGGVDQKGSAGLGPGNLSIPNWIEYVKELFPKESKEVLEKDLVERSDIKDIIANPELFEKVEPSLEMVKTIINLKDLLPENVKDIARKLVKKVVEDLRDKFKDGVEKHIIGAIKRDKHTPIKVFRNIDWKESIRRNLKHYDSNLKKLIMAEPRFFSAEKKKKPWQIVVLIDESGSMTNSIIYSVVIASIFASLPAVHTNLVIFDTKVVDLSDRVDDPVEVLMTVQLGGGTDITKAVRYGQSLIKNTKKTIMVIISDFYEGRSYDLLTKALKDLLEGQTKILGIAALDYNNEPMYNRDYAKFMNTFGIDLLACTPNNLPELIAKLMT